MNASSNPARDREGCDPVKRRRDVCPICIDPMLRCESFRLPGCGHSMHTGCFLQYVQFNVSATRRQQGQVQTQQAELMCPVCRSRVLDLGLPPAVVHAFDGIQQQPPSTNNQQASSSHQDAHVVVTVLPAPGNNNNSPRASSDEDDCCMLMAPRLSSVCCGLSALVFFLLVYSLADRIVNAPSSVPGVWTVPSDYQ